jgi:hypothetical protein
MDIVSPKAKLESAKHLLNQADEIINHNRFGEEQLALFNLRKAEALINSVMENLIAHSQDNKIVEILTLAMQMSKPLEEQTFYLAKLALDTLITYNLRQQSPEALPKWDIENFREAQQLATWRQRAETHIARLIGAVDKSIESIRH